MKRGDVVIVAAAGDYGKPKSFDKQSPAVVVQSDAFPATHASVIICQMTSAFVEASDFRVAVAPDAANGLREPSQIMADKPVTIRRACIGATVGRLNAIDPRRLDVASSLRWGWRIEGVLLLRLQSRGPARLWHFRRRYQANPVSADATSPANNCGQWGGNIVLM